MIDEYDIPLHIQAQILSHLQLYTVDNLKNIIQVIRLLGLTYNYITIW